MKKIVLILLIVVLTFSFASCGNDTPKDKEVAGINDGNSNGVEISQEILAKLNMTEEEFSALSPEKQQAILDELGVVIQQQKNTPEPKPTPVKYTPQDVENGGKFVVVLGDWSNTITLYYEDGVLVKVVEEFRKSSEEEPMVAVYEGDGVNDYTFNHIDWANSSLQEILDKMKDYGNFGLYEITRIEQL